ncbi:MAG: hypothetical protein ABIG93_04845 [archaeon]|nr:hypothetical protein [Nanoarchaeota archaeon]
MKKIAIFLTLFCLISIVLVSSAVAETKEFNVDDLGSEISEMEGSRVPSFAESLFGDELMNVHILKNSGDEFVLGMVTENGVVTSVQGTALENAVLEIYMTEEVAKKIYESDDPVNAMKNALDKGDITYTVNGFFNKIKFSIIKAFTSLFGGSDDDGTSEEDVPASEDDTDDDETDEEEFDGCVKVEVDSISGSTMSGPTYLDDGDYDTDYFGYVAVNEDMEYSAGYAGYDTCNGANYINEYYCGEGSNTNFETVLCENGCISAEGTDYPAFAKCAEASDDTEGVESEEEEETEDDSSDDSGTDDSVDDESDEEDEVVEDNKHYVEVNEDGFEPDELTINVGDTVVWNNERTGRLDQMMIVGAQKCTGIDSGFLEFGDSFEWTFDEAKTCVIVDGITTTQLMKIYIEE